MIGSRPASKTAEMTNVVEQKRIAGISAQTSSDVARIFLFASRKHEKNEKIFITNELIIYLGLLEVLQLEKYSR